MGKNATDYSIINIPMHKSLWSYVQIAPSLWLSWACAILCRQRHVQEEMNFLYLWKGLESGKLYRDKEKKRGLFLYLIFFDTIFFSCFNCILSGSSIQGIRHYTKGFVLLRQPMILVSLTWSETPLGWIKISTYMTGVKKMAGDGRYFC